MVEKRPRRTIKGQEVGSQCHKRMEHLLLTGEDVRGRIEQAGHSLIEPYLKYAPFNGGPLRVEQPLEGPALTTPAGVRIVGYADVVLPPVDPHLANVVDHKFKKSITTWATTSEELASDTQAIVYGAWYVRAFVDAQHFRFTHHTHQTQGQPKATATSHTFALTELANKWQSLTRIIDEEMREDAARKSGADVKPAENEATCRAYGGCSFADFCPSSPRNKLTAALAARTQEVAQPMSSAASLISRLRGQQAAPPPAQTTPSTSTPAPAHEPPAAGDSIQVKDCKPDLHYEHKGRVLKCQIITPGGTYGIFQDEGGKPETLTGTEIVKPAPAIPAAPESAGLTASGAEQGKLYLINGTTKATFLCRVNGKFSFAPADGSVPIMVDDSAVIVPTTPDVRPDAVNPPDAAPPAITNHPEPVPEATPAPESFAIEGATVAEPTKRTRKPRNTAAPEASQGEGIGVVVLVDCAAAFPTTSLDAMVLAKAREEAARFGLVDLSMAGPDTPLGFGKWKGMLRNWALDLALPPGIYSVTAGEFTGPVIEALVAQPDKYKLIRSLR